MAQKKFKQNFAANFGGVDGLSSAIEDDEGRVNLATNMEFAASNSLRGITGYQRAAHSAGMFGVFPYTYSRTQDQYVLKYQVAAGTYPNQTADIGSTKTTADGATIQKTIGINQQVWSLEDLTIPVARISGGYPFSWYSEADVTGLVFKLKVFNDVAGVATQLSSFSLTSIYAALTTLSALAELSINPFDRSLCPPVAIASAAGTTTLVGTTTYGSTYSVAVTNSPHTFKVGDIISFPKSGQLVGGIVVATTATLITYAGAQVTTAIGDVLGYLGQDASAFPVGDTSRAASGDLNFTFPYWRLLADGDRSNLPHLTIAYDGCFSAAKTLFTSRSLGSFYAPPNAVNDSGNLYVASSALFVPGVKDYTSYAGHLVKIDGQQPIRAGLPAPELSNTPAAGALTGNYKYKAFYRRVDAQGNIIDGPVSDPLSVTYAAQQAVINVGRPVVGNVVSGFQTRGCLKVGTETFAANAFFYVDDGAAGPPFIQVGDPVAYANSTSPLAGLAAGSTAAPGTLVRSYVADVCVQAATISPTSESIRIGSTIADTINDNSPISAGLTCVVLRTAAGGNQYYKLYETPITPVADYDFTDNVTDANLTTQEQYIEIPIGKEHDAPPRCSLVCQHQGGLVVARGSTSPNTVAFSSVDGPEAFPLASNSLDVPSTQSGYVTGIASDTNDRLAVCKRRGYYDVVGDLDGGNFTVNVKNEGDYGITSHASIARVRDSLIGLSDNGFVVIKDGELLPYVFNDVNANLVNRPTYPFEWAVATNDSYGRNYACAIPSTKTDGTGPAPIHYVLDYSRGKMIAFDRLATGPTDAAGGMASLGEEFYHLASLSGIVYRRLQRFTPTVTTGYPTRTVGDFYYQDVYIPQYILESNVINLGEPDVLNTPIRVRVWSIPNEYGEDGWLPFSLRVIGVAGTAGFGTDFSITGADTDTIINFPSGGPGFVDVKLRQDKKTHFYVLRLYSYSMGGYPTLYLSKQAPFITGYEILYAENYKAEDLVK